MTEETQEEKPTTKVIAFRIPTSEFEKLVEELKQQGKPISQKDIAELFLLKEKEREKLKAIEEFKQELLASLKPKEQYFDEFLEEHVSQCPECQKTLFTWLQSRGFKIEKIEESEKEKEEKEEVKPQQETQKQDYSLLPGVI